MPDDYKIKAGDLNSCLCYSGFKEAQPKPGDFGQIRGLIIRITITVGSAGIIIAGYQLIHLQLCNSNIIRQM